MKPMEQFTISPELRRKMTDDTTPHKVIISFKKGEDVETIAKGIEQKLGLSGKRMPRKTQYYVFAELTRKEIETIAKSVKEISKIWPDRKLSKALDKSTRTIKADAVWRTFEGHGEGITWAVLDTGIDADHSHFAKHRNVLKSLCKDFTGGGDWKDKDSHGTHVSGIIAGESTGNYMKPEGDTETKTKITASGVAPKANLVALKVLDDEGNGRESWSIEALEYVRATNEQSREMVIHGVNMSLSGSFKVSTYGCGHTPLCEEVNRLVLSGVVVCCAAGNTGWNIYATLEEDGDEVLPVPHFSSMTIEDPGNAQYVITVGSTHKENPHTYGVTFFSAKGPTGDGRLKPDLVAPGEKIVSALSRFSEESKEMKSKDVSFTTMSGTSQASPHVSGAIAAFLSVKPEFIGRPLDVKKIIMDTCTDLNRERYVQGKGLIDLFRAVQSV